MRSPPEEVGLGKSKISVFGGEAKDNQTMRRVIEKPSLLSRILYLFEGFDHAEIGEVLRISESTSKSQFNRAKKKLKELLESR